MLNFPKENVFGDRLKADMHYVLRPPNIHNIHLVLKIIAVEKEQISQGSLIPELGKTWDLSQRNMDMLTQQELRAPRDRLMASSCS